MKRREFSAYAEERLKSYCFMTGVTQRAFFDASLRDMDNALLTMRDASSRGSAFDVGNAGIRAMVARSRRPTTHDGQPCGVVNNL